MTSMTPATAQKTTGAYYTPPVLADFLTRWALREPADTTLDPGCGEAVFLLAAWRRLLDLGASPTTASTQLYGIERDANALATSRERLGSVASGLMPALLAADFFSLPSPNGLLEAPTPAVNAVIGNPPYIRYHHFAGETRRRALETARIQGVSLSALTSAWAPYLVHACGFLQPSGRLAFVLPAELLQTDYAAPVRAFLLQRFRSVTVVTFECAVFPGAMVDAVLLLADAGVPVEQSGLRVLRLHDLADLGRYATPEALLAEPPVKAPADKWTEHLLPSEGVAIYHELLARAPTVALGDIARVDVGFVSGNNKFFLLSEPDVEQWGIEPDLLMPAVARSSDITGAYYRPEDWTAQRDAGSPCYALAIDAAKSAVEVEQRGVWKYLQAGMTRSVHTGYKCRSRRPWYAVPQARRVPDAFLTYLSHEAPRLVSNIARVANTNLLHCVEFSRDALRATATTSGHWPASWYSTLTLLSAELCGRSYGGGVLKLETKEAERVRLLTPPLGYHAVLDTVDMALRHGQLDAARAAADQALLAPLLDTDARKALEAAYQAARGRRMIRARTNGVQRRQRGVENSQATSRSARFG